MNDTVEIGFLIYPGLTQLDVTGPAQVLSLVPGARIHLIAPDLAPVPTDAGFPLLPTTRYADCPPLEVLCVPGGVGQEAVMRDAAALEFLQRVGAQARYITSVCGGSLILGAAGLLRGYKAACHWAFRHVLPTFGAEPVAERIVTDRNRISGGGVTAGIDFGLVLAAQLAGTDAAKAIQLFLEYDPQPPFDAGTPEKAGAAITAKVRECFDAARKAAATGSAGGRQRPA